MITLEQHVWGLTPEGEAVVVYSLRNSHGCEVRLCNIGASIISFTAPDRNGKIEDIILGFKAMEDYISDPICCCKTVGRVANRIAGGRMTIEGKEYRLEVNNGRNHLHGGSKGFAKRLWDSRTEGDRVVFSLLSEDGDQNYPGELNVEVAYDFDDDNRLEITYYARTDKTTAVNLTNHAYWNLDGESAGSILDHELRLAASTVAESDPYQIPTGRMLDVAGTPMDFRTFHSFRAGIDSEFNRIRDFKGYDHFFPFDGWKRNILAEAAELRSAASGRRLKVYTSQRGAMVYTGNWLGGSPETKSGNRYEDYGGVAIECQNFPDAVNQPALGDVLLHPGETYCQKIVFETGTY